MSVKFVSISYNIEVSLQSFLFDLHLYLPGHCGGREEDSGGTEAGAGRGDRGFPEEEGAVRVGQDELRPPHSHPRQARQEEQVNRAATRSYSCYNAFQYLILFITNFDFKTVFKLQQFLIKFSTLSLQF